MFLSTPLSVSLPSASSCLLFCQTYMNIHQQGYSQVSTIGKRKRAANDEGDNTPFAVEVDMAALNNSKMVPAFRMMTRETRRQLEIVAESGEIARSIARELEALSFRGIPLQDHY